MGLLDRFRERRTAAFAQAVAKSVVDTVFSTKDPGASILFGAGSREKLVSPYKQLPILAAAVNAKASRMARVPVRFYRQNTDNEVLSHPLIDLLRHPSPNERFPQMVRLLGMQIDLDGEWLIYKDPETARGGVPLSLTRFKRSEYEPWFEAGQWRGWEITHGKRKVRATHDEVLFHRLPDPDSRFRGLSKVESYLVSGETEFSARRYNRKFFDNDASPSNHWHFSGKLNEAQKRYLENYLGESRRGTEEAHGTVITSGGEVTHNNFGTTHRDAQFVEQFSLSLHDVCAALNVDPSIIGFEKETKYASAKEARRYFWTDVIIPELMVYEELFNEGMCRAFGMEMRFDLQTIEALQANMVEQVQVAEALGRLGWTPNQINDRLDLGLPPAPNGDDPLPGTQPFMLQAKPEEQKNAVIGSQVPEGPVAITPEDLEAMRKEQRARQWKAAVSGISEPNRKMRSRLRAYFHDVGEKLMDQAEKSLAELRTKDITGEDVDDAFDFEKLAAIFLEFIEAGAVVGYRQINAAFRPAGGELPPDLAAMIPRRAAMVAEVRDHAREDVRSAIQRAVRESSEEALTEAQTTARIRDYLGVSISKLERRARTIARTEVHGGYNEARHIAMVDLGAIGKRWISSRDAAVRDSHDRLDGEERAIEEAFSNGLMHPHGDGPAREVVNCRCIEVPIYRGTQGTDERIGVS